MITAQEVTLLIKQSLPDAHVDVIDMGGGDHLEVNVVSEEFFGLSLVQQHQLVYGALKNELKTETIHALALKTSTPQ
ncbi:BolA family protein [Prochlorococcus marinus]|uniref:BolA family protein n=1 Tax=Prochlorococcus marinus TaxID=1219 RepID=UPI0022B2F834|nr:BolA family transcriptional regulator [Prochlorococcus marinus]